MEFIDIILFVSCAGVCLMGIGLYMIGIALMRMTKAEEWDEPMDNKEGGKSHADAYFKRGSGKI